MPVTDTGTGLQISDIISTVRQAAEAEEEMPAVDAGPGTLPGWGSWANAKRMQRDAETAARKAKQ